jgi:hypothetical protein
LYIKTISAKWRFERLRELSAKIECKGGQV